MRLAKRELRLAACVSVRSVLGMAHLPAASAQLYWDTNGSDAGAGTPPAGTWGTWGLDPFWNLSSDGTGLPGAWSAGSLAVFSAGSDATGPFTIAVSGTQSIGGLSVEEGSPTLTGGGLDIGSTGATFDIAPGSTLTMQSILSGSGARLTKSDDGTLVLGTVLNQANSFSGGLSIAGGAVEFQGENSGVAGAANALGAAPLSAVADYLQFSNGGILQSFRNNTSSSFVIANRGVTLGAGGGGFDVAMPAASLSYAGIIAGPTGSGPFIKQGPGELKISGANTYTGGTLIRAGVLTIASQTSTTPGAATVLGAYPAALSPGAILLDGGTLRNTSTSHSGNNFIGPAFGIQITDNDGTLDVPGISGGTPAALVYSGEIAPAEGAGNVVLNKTGAGELQLSGTNTFAKLNITSGLLRAASSDRNFGAAPLGTLPDAITVDGGAIGTTLVSIISPVTRGITIGPGGMGVILNSQWTINGPITGAGGLTLGNVSNFAGDPSQTLALAGSNTYQGDTTINNGTLSAQSTGAIPANGNVALSTTSTGTAVFDISLAAGQTLTVGALTGGGSNPGLSGNVSLTSGTLSVGNGNVDFNYAGQISGAGQLQKAGTGVMTIDNWVYANTGDTTISAGTVRVGDASSGLSDLGLVNITLPGTYDMNGFDGTIGALAGAGRVINGGNLTLAGVNASPQTFSGGFQGGELIKSGPGTEDLTGVNGFASVAINGGILGARYADTLGNITGSVTLDGGGTLQALGTVLNPSRPIIINAGGGTIDTNSFAFSFANVSGTGALTKAGAGNLALANVRVGDLTITAGSITIAPNASPSGVSIVNSTSISAGATLDLANNKLIDHTTGVGTWDGTGYTGLSGLVASARAGGTWTGSGITSSRASTPSSPGSSNLYTLGVAKVGDVLQIADSATATFAGQAVVGTDTIVMFTYGGDANLDGKINIDDYGRIDGNVGESGSVFGWYDGDFNYDGKINIDDYGIIDGNIGLQGGPIPTFIGGPPLAASAPGVSAVPEPQMLALLIPGGLAMRRRWRRRAGVG